MYTPRVALANQTTTREAQPMHVLTLALLFFAGYGLRTFASDAWGILRDAWAIWKLH